MQRFYRFEDTAVNDQLARQPIGLWQLRGLRYVEQYEFERALHLHHDLVDVNNPRQKVEIVYPVLVDLIDRLGPRPRGRAGARHWHPSLLLIGEYDDR